MRAIPSRGSRVVKKLLPGAPGTKRLAERFGSALVCVRYRIDPQARRRFTTVELVVADAPMADAPGDVLVRIAFEEADLRQKVKDAGGKWVQAKKLWRLPRAKAKALNLLSRVASAARKDA